MAESSIKLSLAILLVFGLMALAPPSSVGAASTLETAVMASVQTQSAGSTSITPNNGPPGSTFTVIGTGFRSFDSVTSIRLGNREVLGSRTINTDTDGRFEARDLFVPGLDPGYYSVVVRVGSGSNETTATGLFEVTAQQGGTSSGSVNQGMAPLINSDNLVVVFLFRNDTKDWVFFDPRPQFAPFNTLTELKNGEIYWIKVRRDQTATLNGRTRNLSCASPGTASENCWNIEVW